MTLQTRRLSLFPWSFPFNTRELKPGQHVTMVNLLTEGVYIWKLIAIDADSARTIHEQPYHVNENAEFTSFEPRKTESVTEKDHINTFGPEDRNWRWIEGKTSKET